MAFVINGSAARAPMSGWKSKGRVDSKGRRRPVTCRDSKFLIN